MNGEVGIADSQHRLDCFLQTGLPKGCANITAMFFDTWVEAALYFDKLNTLT